MNCSVRPWTKSASFRKPPFSWIAAISRKKSSASKRMSAISSDCSTRAGRLGKITRAGAKPGMTPSPKPLVFIISAPSGSGKSTLTNELLKLVAGLDFSISYTTRSPRGSEQNGKQYYFVARDEFDRMVRAGEFLEHAKVHDN